VKSFPLVGQVVDLRWKGEDFGLGIIGRLNGDVSIKHAVMRSDDVGIYAHGDRRCWIISREFGGVPLRRLWSCYQAIARHLLAEWSPG